MIDSLIAYLFSLFSDEPAILDGCSGEMRTETWDTSSNLPGEGCEKSVREFQKLGCTDLAYREAFWTTAGRSDSIGCEGFHFLWMSASERRSRPTITILISLFSNDSAGHLLSQFTY
jgi:hypothetical protein